MMMMMIWIIPAVIIGGLVIGTVVNSIMKTTSNKESETTIPERRSDLVVRRETQPINSQYRLKEEKSIALEFCPNCGARIQDSNGKFCTSCGNPLS